MSSFQYHMVVGPSSVKTWWLKSNFDEDEARLYRSFALSAVPHVNGDSMYVKAARSDLPLACEQHQKQQDRVHRLRGDGDSSRDLLRQPTQSAQKTNWRPALYPAQEAENRVAPLAPNAPPPGLQAPGWSTGSLPVAKALLAELDRHRRPPLQSQRERAVPKGLREQVPCHHPLNWGQKYRTARLPLSL